MQSPLFLNLDPLLDKLAIQQGRGLNQGAAHVPVDTVPIPLPKKLEQLAQGLLSAKIVGRVSQQNILYLLIGIEDRNFVKNPRPLTDGITDHLRGKAMDEMFGKVRGIRLFPFPLEMGG